jgi:hypothetical protein
VSDIIPQTTFELPLDELEEITNLAESLGISPDRFLGIAIRLAVNAHGRGVARPRGRRRRGNP